MRFTYLYILLIFGTVFIELHEHHKHSDEMHPNAHKQSRFVVPLSKIASQIPGYKELSITISTLIKQFGTLTLCTKIFSAIAIISIIPFLLLALLPISIEHDPSSSLLLHLMLSFAAGCLLGDAFLHIIPHSLMSDPSKSSDIGILVLSGILIFFLAEKLIAFIRSYNESITHRNSEEFFTEASIRMKWLLDIIQLGMIKDLKIDKETATSLYTPSKIPTDPTVKKSCHGHSSNMAVSGILNLFADTIHNFMDGLAIGSAFMINDKAGLLTTVSIFWHEIPHELSDFAILLRSGFSKTKALMLQLVTAIGAVSGGLAIYYSKGNETAFAIIPPVAAGGFIYMSCVTIMPDMLSKKGLGFFTSFLEVSTFILGVSIFQLMAVYE